jgi:hypothetical protein
LLESAAADIKSIGSALDAAHAAAVVPTTGLAAAGADEVSAAVAALFGGFGQEVQPLNTQASAFQQQFMLTLSSGAGRIGPRRQRARRRCNRCRPCSAMCWV